MGRHVSEASLAQHHLNWKVLCFSIPTGSCTVFRSSINLHEGCIDRKDDMHALMRPVLRGARISPCHGADQATRTGAIRSPGVRARGGLENRELLVADIVLLSSYSLYKQIAAITYSPTFPGWLAPLSFNPTRFLELLSFTTTLLGTWVAVGALCRRANFPDTHHIPCWHASFCFYKL